MRWSYTGIPCANLAGAADLDLRSENKISAWCIAHTNGSVSLAAVGGLSDAIQLAANDDAYCAVRKSGGVAVVTS